jgi:hypothetical protein
MRRNPGESTALILLRQSASAFLHLRKSVTICGSPEKLASVVMSFVVENRDSLPADRAFRILRPVSGP